MNEYYKWRNKYGEEEKKCEEDKQNELYKNKKA